MLRHSLSIQVGFSKKKNSEHLESFSSCLPPLLLSPVRLFSFHLGLECSVISISLRRPMALCLRGYVKLFVVDGLLAHNITQRIEAWASKDKPLKGWQTVNGVCKPITMETVCPSFDIQKHSKLCSFVIGRLSPVQSQCYMFILNV